ncbi:hypothetical protein, conserved [Leishmania tarentolae]|uniref:Stealth protein CR2 conserved region 2 domain-containing protein n=1 Tax=Leishmania tarentolae TaxID=5689 RepID=A0A640KDG6_LEITA|nr:hypothetical protein, conserved [Leishmania tarentolae]
MPWNTTPPPRLTRAGLLSRDVQLNTSTAKSNGARKTDPRMRGGARRNFREEGEYVPEEPHLLPGLQIQRRTFTPAELLERFGDADIIYSFVNGSEANHQYRKQIHRACLQEILSAESNAFEDPLLYPAAVSEHSTPRCLPNHLRSYIVPRKTAADLLRAVEAAATSGVDHRDRETDELRHSVRSVEQHVQWHRGRVVIVSPGHHPTWVDGAKNFLAGVCGDARVQALRSSGTHLRVTTVHQDALMPYGMRLTVNSHAIEQRLWRVRNVTAVHVYMNDDYFVNRDVAITDLLVTYPLPVEAYERCGVSQRTEGVCRVGGLVGILTRGSRACFRRWAAARRRRRGLSGGVLDTYATGVAQQHHYR